MFSYGIPNYFMLLVCRIQTHATVNNAHCNYATNFNC